MDNGVSPRDQLQKTLNADCSNPWTRNFKFDFTALERALERIEKPRQLNAQAPVTRSATRLKQVTSEAGSLPIGAVVLLSDGADNAGGIDLTT